MEIENLQNLGNLSRTESFNNLKNCFNCWKKGILKFWLQEKHFTELKPGCLCDNFLVEKSENFFLKKENGHCVKSVRIRSFSGPYSPAFGMNTNQKNSEYGHFSRSGWNQTFTKVKAIKTFPYSINNSIISLI